MNYKNCGVPHCKNTSIKTPHKLFLHVPFKWPMRKKWLKAAGRDAERLSPKTQMHFCEDHFDLEKDMLNHMEMSVTGSVKRIRLRDGCLPSKFDCQRDRGKTKTTPLRSAVAKRRKIATTQECNRILEEYRMNEEKAQGSTTPEGNENDTNININRDIDSESSSSDERCKQSSSTQGDPPTPVIKTEPSSDPPEIPEAASGVPEPSSTQYVIKGKRFVNVGYLIRSLQKLNDHGGADCNFSDMTICGETKEGWNIGVELSCRVCFTSAVVWMEDPDAKLIKTRPNLQAATISQTQSPIISAKVPLRKSKPHPRKTPTPPPDNPIQKQFLAPLPLARSVFLPTSKDVPKVTTTNQSHLTNLPLLNPPQITPFVKQDAMSHGASSFMSNVPPSSSATLPTVQLLFFVDQPASSQMQNTAPPTATPPVESITVTPDIFVGRQKYSATSLGISTTSENITVTPDICTAEVLPVDLNLVKKEVEDKPGTSGDGHQSMDVNDKPGVCLVPMSETSLDPAQTLFASYDPKSPTSAEILKASSSASDIKISSVTSCNKTYPTKNRTTSATLSETADSSVPTVSCTPTLIICKKVMHDVPPSSKEVFKRTADGESSSKLSKKNRKGAKKDL